MNILIDIDNYTLLDLDTRARVLSVSRRSIINHAIKQFLNTTTVQDNLDLIEVKLKQKSKDKALNQLMKEII